MIGFAVSLWANQQQQAMTDARVEKEGVTAPAVVVRKWQGGTHGGSGHVEVSFFSDGQPGVPGGMDASPSFPGLMPGETPMPVTVPPPGFGDFAIGPGGRIGYHPTSGGEKRVSPSFYEQVSEGGQVTVKYLPASPAKFVILDDRGSGAGASWFSALWCLASVAALIWRLTRVAGWGATGEGRASGGPIRGEHD
jgi:hypothetical protein